MEMTRIVPDGPHAGCWVRGCSSLAFGAKFDKRLDGEESS